MNLFFNRTAARNYKSRAQQIRVMSEMWLVENLFCLHCGGKLLKKKNNNPVGDVLCAECGFEYELKSKNGNFSDTINDGSYKTMMVRINSNSMPSFFFLNYFSPELKVKNLFAVPRYFFTNSIIERRKPLSNLARRANWVGCKIKLSDIPASGKLAIIANGDLIAKHDIICRFNKLLFMDRTVPKSRGWLVDVVNIIEKIGKDEFCLDDVYDYEDELQAKHANNHHIRPKIRQQLRILRDNKYLSFLGEGKYKIN